MFYTRYLVAVNPFIIFPMTTSSIPAVQDGYTGTTRLYTSFIKREAGNWRLGVPSYAIANEPSAENVEKAKAAFVQYVSECLQTFVGGDALADLLVRWHKTASKAEYQAFYHDEQVYEACTSFVAGLNINTFKVPVAWNSSAENIILRAPGQVLSLMNCTSLASVFSLKMIVTPYTMAAWNARKGQFKLAWHRAMPL